jgi:hypothetical protein
MRPVRGSVLLDTGGFDIVRVMQHDHYGFFDEAFGSDIEFWKKTSPLYTLGPGARPMLLVCSTQRQDKPCTEAEKFASKAKSLNIKTEVLPQDLSHREVNVDLGIDGAYNSTVDAILRKILAL